MGDSPSFLASLLECWGHLVRVRLQKPKSCIRSTGHRCGSEMTTQAGRLLLH